MNRRIVFIVILGVIVLAAGAGVLFFLRSALKAQKQSSPAYHDAWKLERTQGIWASSDGKYELAVDAYDCTLQIDGVYAIVARLQFDASETPQVGEARFTLQIDPASVINPDAEGAVHCEIEALWYEDTMLHMRLHSAEDDPVCLLHITSSPPPAWPYH